MTYVVCVLILFSICLLAKSPKTKYTYFFVLMTVGLIGMICTSVRMWGYEYSDIWFFKVDYQVLQQLIKYNWSYYGMMDTFNIFVAVYMMALQFFILFDEKKGSKKFKYTYTSGFVFFIVFYLWFYNTQTALQIFLSYTSSSNMSNFLQKILFINGVVVLLQTFFILFPAIRVFVTAKKEKLWPKRNQKFTYGSYICVISLFVLIYFVYGPLRNNYLDLNPSLLLGIREFFKVSTYHYAILILVICVFVVSILLVMLRGKMLITMAVIRRNVFKNRWNIDTETKEIFHMLKNVLFNIEAAAKQGIASPDTEEKDKRLQSIADMCEKRISDFFEITAVSNRRKYEIQPVPVSEIVSEALERITIPEEIHVEYINLSEEDLIYADSVSMTEAIVNVLRNAVEAFDGIQKDDKTIAIHIQNDDEMVCVEITDNGKGMNRREAKVSFKPLFTTKSRNSNWGVGLSYVYKTILAHCGHIKINSSKGDGTRVSIILYRKEVNRLWKR